MASAAAPIRSRGPEPFALASSSSATPTGWLAPKAGDRQFSSVVPGTGNYAEWINNVEMTFRDGKLVGWVTNVDMQDFMAQLGIG